MSFDSVMMIARFLALAVNITTMFRCMRPKYGIGFSLAAFVGCAALVGGVTRIAGVNGFLLNFSGMFFLPVVLWLFQGQTFQKVFAFFMQYQFTALLISLADAMAGLSVGYESPCAPTVMFALVLLFLGAYLAVVLRFGRRLFERLFINGRRGEWAVYSFGAVFSFVCVLGVRWLAIDARFYIGLVLFVLWSFGVLCFAIVNTHEKTKHKYEAEFAARMISNASGHYQQIDELNRQIHILRHDMKYHLTVLGELLAEDNREELTRYLGEITEQLEKVEPRVYCGNQVLNALLASYAERCDALGIRYDVAVSLPDTLPLPNYELCIVLGNLLENAVEACGELESGRQIELAIQHAGKQLIIKAANSYKGDRRFDESGDDANALPLSTKKDGGLGLRSVKAVAEKHCGELMIQCDKETFTAYVTAAL